MPTGDMNDHVGFGLAPMKSEGAQMPFDPMSASEAVNTATESVIQLPSGRSFYANCGIVGISPNGDVTQGYDGSFGSDGWGDNAALTAEERRELATIMIGHWIKWGDI